MEEVTTMTGAVSDNNLSLDTVFAFRTSEKVSFENDITDQYVEDNSSIQDHIGIKPLKLTLSGFIAEKSYQITWEDVEIDTSQNMAMAAYEGLTGLLPEVSTFMQVVANKAYTIGQAAQRVVYNPITKAIMRKMKRNKKSADIEEAPMVVQKAVWEYLRDSRNNRTIFSVNTPFGTFDNMVIESVELEQSDTAYQSELTVTLKEIRVASTQLTEIKYKEYSDRVNKQRAIEENLGNVQGVDTNKSTLRKYHDRGVNLIQKLGGM